MKLGYRSRCRICFNTILKHLVLDISFLKGQIAPISAGIVTIISPVDPSTASGKIGAMMKMKHPLQVWYTVRSIQFPNRLSTIRLLPAQRFQCYESIQTYSLRKSINYFRSKQWCPQSVPGQRETDPFENPYVDHTQPWPKFLSFM